MQRKPRGPRRSSDVTAVAIHTPNALHAEEVIAAARAGKHVFCDKPMTTTVADAERVLRECEKAGTKLGLNFHNRFMPSFMETQRIVESGEIGDVLLVQVEASGGPDPASVRAGWRVDPAIAGLGATMSIGVHVYDILRFILSSEIAQVTAYFDTPRGIMEKTNLSIFRFANGVMAQMNANQTTPNAHNDFVIYGTKGRITGRGVTRSRISGTLEVLANDGKQRVTEFPAINAHAASIAAFSQALLDGRAPSPSGIDGLRSVQLTEAMARSAWDGVHVNINY